MRAASLHGFFRKMNGSYPGWRLDAAVILVMTAAFCLRFYHRFFIFQGDVLINLYMHANIDLFEGGWDPHVWGYLGWYPIFGALFPFNVLMHSIYKVFFFSSIPAALTFSQINAFFSLFCLAFFIYIFFRFLGRGRCASLAGSVVVAFSGFLIQAGVRELDLFYLHSFLCVPLALVCLIKANMTGRIVWTLPAGVAIGLSLLGGVTTPMFMFLPGALGLYLVGRPLSECGDRRSLLRCAFFLAAASAIGVLIGCATALPCVKYLGLSSRVISAGQTIECSASGIYTFFTMLYRDWWARTTAGLPLGHYHEFDALLGMPVLLLAAWGFCRPRREAPAKWPMVLFALIALVAMHSRYLPQVIARPFIAALSVFSIRYPFRFFMVLLLPVAYFAATGIDALERLYEARRAALILAAAGLALAVYLLYGIFLWSAVTPYELRPALAAALAISVIFFLVILTGGLLRHSQRWSSPDLIRVTLVCVLYMFVWFSYTDTAIRTDYSRREYRGNTASTRATARSSVEYFFERPAELYRNGPRRSFYRIYRPGLLRQNVWAGRAEQVGIAFEPINDPLTPAVVARYHDAITDLDSPLFDLYSVAVIDLSNIPGFSSRKYPGEKLRPTGLPGVYYNPQAMERYRIVHALRSFSSDDELWSALRNAPREELEKTVFLVRAPALSGGQSAPLHPGDAVTALETTPTKAVLEATCTAPGYLVVSEVWFPAWEASVDGKKEELRKAYGTFWAVALEKGVHRVTFTFNDRFARAGKIISLISLIAALCAWYVFRGSGSKKENNEGRSEKI
ncbi:MAG: hypothetical protein WCG78_03090 [Candidatus Omnitrophota bacterium]